MAQTNTLDNSQKVELMKLAASIGAYAGETYTDIDRTVSNYQKLIGAVQSPASENQNSSS